MIRTLILCLALGLVFACGDDDGNSGQSEEEARAEFCNELDAFGSTLSDLGSDLISLDFAAARSAAEGAGDEFDDLLQAAREVSSGRSDELDAAWTQLRDAVGSLGGMGSIGTDLEAVGTAFSDLLSTLGTLAGDLSCTN